MKKQVIFTSKSTAMRHCPACLLYLAFFLCSDEASFLTGTDYPIDGGFIKLNGQ